MNTKIFLFGAVVCLVVGFTASSHPFPIQSSANEGLDPEDRKLGVIRGRVLAEDGGYPLAKATLSLRSTRADPDGLSRTVRTNGRGQYAFKDLETGRYVLTATRSGYIPKNYGQRTSQSLRRENGATSLSVRSGQILDGIDFHLIRAGAVEGRVVDQDNEPLVRVRVMLSSYRSREGGLRLRPFGQDETDDRGRFRIFGIPPGNYLLSASPHLFVSRSADLERSFQPTYYPGVLSAEDAVPVQLAAGADVGGFDITIIQARSYSVSGRVLMPNGSPAQSVWIMSSNESNKGVFAMMGRSTDTNLNGDFSLSGLVPGRHRLYTRAGGGEDMQMASTTVDVADQDLNGLTLVLGKGAQITGSIVTDREDSDLDWRRISLNMVPSHHVGRISFGGTATTLEENFTFKIVNLPEGPYHLAVRLPPGNHYVASIHAEGHDITDRPIEMRNNDRLAGVEVHVSSEGAQIIGVVEQPGKQQVAEGATVLVFADDPQYRGRPSRFTRTTQTDQRGQFGLQGLVPGQYLVCALTDHESGLESDPDYLRSLEKDSERVDLSPGQTVQEFLEVLAAPKTK